MQELTRRNLRAWSMLGQRGTVCGVALIEIMEEYQNSYTLTADLAHLSGLDRVQHMFPERFVNVGIAEQNMIGIAAGLAAEGNVVFATTYATFLTMRCYEQIRHHMGYQHMNIKLIGSAAGVEMGMSGNTHYTYEDIAIMRAIPNITVVSPADPAEAYQIMHQAAATEGPMYIRLTGGMNQQMVTKCEDSDIQIGKSKELQSGTDAAVIFAGNIAGTVQKAAELLEGEGISTSVIDMHTIKPLDTKQLENQMGKKIVVTVEEHSIIGGLGGVVSEYYAQFEQHPKVVRIGVEDQFLHPAGKELLLETAGLTQQKIYERIRKELNR